MSDESIPEGDRVSEHGDEDAKREHPASVMCKLFDLLSGWENREADLALEKRWAEIEVANREELIRSIVDRVENILGLPPEVSSQLLTQALIEDHYIRLVDQIRSLSNMAVNSGTLQAEDVLKSPTAFELTAHDENTGKSIRFKIRLTLEK